MTISDQIDRARRAFAREFEEDPHGVILSPAQLSDARIEKIWQSNFLARDPQSGGQASYKGLRVFLWAVPAAGPAIIGESASHELRSSAMIRRID